MILRFLYSFRAVAAACILTLALPAASRADFSLAKANFEARPLPYRYTIQMLLGVAGYWPAVANDDYSHRLYAAITQFQVENSLPATGQIGTADLLRIHALADPLLYRWGMKQIAHPSVNATLWIPKSLLPIEQSIGSGLSFRNVDDSVAVAFTHHNHHDLRSIYNNLMAVPRDHLLYEKLTPEFFVIDTARGDYNAYSRYQNAPDGITGFTLRWRGDDSIHGERIATLMSDLFRAEFTLAQNRYPPAPIQPDPAATVSAQAPQGASSSPAVLSFAPQNAPAPDAVDVAREQAKIAEIQQQKIDRLAPAAHQLINEASALIKANPSHPKLLEFVEMINSLNKALSEKDPDAIEKRSMALSGALHKEPAYVEVEAKRLAEQKRANAKYLGDTIAFAQRQKAFMTSYIAQNPTSATAAAFLPFIRQIDPAVSEANLEKLQALTERVDLSIRQGELSGRFAEFDPPKTPSVVADNVPATNLQVATTDKNRFLIEGDLADVVLMMNTSASAAHIARNLRGEMIFQDGRADVCLYQRTPDPELRLIVKSAIQQLKATAIYFTPVCDQDRPEAYDIVAVNRGAFLSLDSSSALTFLKEIETDAFKKLAVIPGANLRMEADERAKTTATIAADVAAGSREGYGIIVLKTNSSSICAIFSDKIDGQRLALLGAEDRLALDMNASPILTKVTLDEAFVQTQRSQCGAIYASAKDLKDLDAALTRDNIDHRFSVIWFTPPEIDSADHRAFDQKARAAQDAAARQRHAEEERKLAAQRAADAASTNAVKQSELRNQYGKAAQAASAAVANELQKFTDNHAGDAGSKFPTYTAWLNDKFTDHWEVMSINSEIADFGVSNWKERSLNTAFTRVTVKIKNRMLGEYQEACFIAGQIIDSEFSVDRDPIVAACDNVAVIDQWKTAHQFSSRWNL